MTFSRWLALPLLLVALAACGGDPTASDDGGRDETELVFVPVARTAPPLETTIVRFRAVKGEASEVQIRYQYRNGTNGKCLLFRVPANALLRRPNGTEIRPGESVEITITVVNPERFMFQFEPAGLVFDPAAPAEIEISHKYADRDYNLDGKVDATDAAIFAGMRIWRQERPDTKWMEVPTVSIGDFELLAKVPGFTRYALAAD